MIAPNFVVDAVKALEKLPNLAVVGGNTGTVNSFTGVNITDLTGGVFNAETLLEGNNLMCFAFLASSYGSIDILRGLLHNITGPLARLTGAADKLLKGLGCPQLEKYDTQLFKQFPGAKGSY